MSGLEVSTQHLPPGQQSIPVSSSSSSSPSSSSSSSQVTISTTLTSPLEETVCGDCHQRYNLNQNVLSTQTTCSSWGKDCSAQATATVRQLALVQSCLATTARLAAIRPGEKKVLATKEELKKFTVKDLKILAQELGRKLPSKSTLEQKIQALSVYETLPRAPNTKLVAYNPVEEGASEPPLITLNKNSLQKLCVQLEIKKTMYESAKIKATKELERRMLVATIIRERANPGSETMSKTKRKRINAAKQQAPRSSRSVGQIRPKKKQRTDEGPASFKQASSVASRRFIKQINGSGASIVMMSKMFKIQPKLHSAVRQHILEVEMNEDGSRAHATIAHAGPPEEVLADLDFLIDELVAKRAEMIGSLAQATARGDTQKRNVKPVRVIPQSPAHVTGGNAVIATVATA